MAGRRSWRQGCRSPEAPRRRRTIPARPAHPSRREPPPWHTDPRPSPRRNSPACSRPRYRRRPNGPPPVQADGRAVEILRIGLLVIRLRRRKSTRLRSPRSDQLDFVAAHAAERRELDAVRSEFRQPAPSGAAAPLLPQPPWPVPSVPDGPINWTSARIDASSGVKRTVAVWPASRTAVSTSTSPEHRTGPDGPWCRSRTPTVRPE
jgi:hypothetical protein